MADSSPSDAKSLVALLKQSGYLDAPLEAAFRAIPRGSFLAHLPPEEAYRDEAIPIKVDEDGTVLSSSSQPSMMAIMLRQLQLQPGHNVLEIGAGTGYNAALIQHIVGDEGKVTSLEIDLTVAETARANLQRVAMSEVLIVEADGAQGYAPRASYDRIIATAGIWDVPQAWVRQLKPGGILVTPLWVEGFEVSAALVLQPDGTLYSQSNRFCSFIPLRGQDAVPEIAVRVGTSGLYLYSNSKIDSAALQMLISDDSAENYFGISLEAWEYWQGFLPYLVLHIPESFILAYYQVARDASAYGMSGRGFMLMTPGSACFVSSAERGTARSFGSADALLAAQEALAAWERDGKPQGDRLRLRLVPKSAAPETASAPQDAKAYPRRDHMLIVSMELA
ncbi:MAG: methyltransferase domain-containing protein [Chloroflexota bacterium]